MPTLNWIGKEAVVNHDKEVPFRLLKKVKAHSVGDSQNLIIKGDNLEGLKALMPYYIGKVKCIYIDPPYNTGNENWIYNDNVKSPKIKKWLGKVVGGESQDLCRHDKWLCMMYPRLKLLRDLLSDEGVIFVSIDDNEQAHLKLLLDEVFGEENFFARLTWINRTKPKNMGEARFNIQQNTEDVFVYGKVPMTKYPRFNLREFEKKEYPLEKNGRKYRLEPIVERRNLGTLRRDKMVYSLLGIKNKEGYRWQLSQDKYKQLIDEDKIVIKRNKPFQIYFEDEEENYSYKPFWSHFGNKGTAEDGKKELNQLFGHTHGFETVKAINLIKEILFHCTKEEDIILDSFAGSGTTGHAVLDLNKEDGGNRKFILIEMEDDIAKKITAERIKRAIEKYDYKDGFEYCELDKPLFDENGQIEETCDFNQFATYIYFTETQTNIDKKQIDKNFIGESGETEYYLIYKEKYKNVLNKSFLSKLKKTKNKKVIYADFCMVDDDALEKFNIQFKQIPYEVKVY
jgi:adenine-specific DNA-methyltransferase